MRHVQTTISKNKNIPLSMGFHLPYFFFYGFSSPLFVFLWALISLFLWAFISLYNHSTKCETCANNNKQEQKHTFIYGFSSPLFVFMFLWAFISQYNCSKKCKTRSTNNNKQEQKHTFFYGFFYSPKTIFVPSPPPS